MTRQGQLSTIFLKLSDLLLLLLALATTIVVNYAPEAKVSVPHYSVDFLSTRVKLSNAVLCGLLLIIWHIAFNLKGLYLSHRLHSFRNELKQVAGAAFISAIALLIVAQIGRWATLNLWTVSCFFLFTVFYCGGMRFFLRIGLKRLRRRGRNLKKLLVIGGGARSEQFIRLISRRVDLGYRILGYLESDPAFNHGKLAGANWLGTLEDLPHIIDREVIDDVAVALPIKSHYAEIENIIALIEEQGVGILLLSDFFPHRLARCQPMEFEGEPLLTFNSAPPLGWRTEVKRVVDVLGSAILLILFSPLLAIIAVIIKLDSKGSVFFVQERMGYNKRRFQMIKFRTMIEDAEARIEEIEHLNEKEGPIFKIRKDPRITRIGRILRKFSLDELPQLINVFVGDMSLVGPRPLSIRDALKLEESWQKRRFSVRPGLTCLWQISGRSDLSFEEWMQLDLEYIDSWSLSLDGWILLCTVPAVLSTRGAV